MTFRGFVFVLFFLNKFGNILLNLLKGIGWCVIRVITIKNDLRFLINEILCLRVELSWDLGRSAETFFDADWSITKTTDQFI